MTASVSRGQHKRNNRKRRWEQGVILSTGIWVRLLFYVALVVELVGSAGTAGGMGLAGRAIFVLYCTSTCVGSAGDWWKDFGSAAGGALGAGGAIDVSVQDLERWVVFRISVPTL